MTPSTLCPCQRACSPECDCRCHRFTDPATAARAGARLSSMWDRARDMYSRAGLRPYTVSIIRARSHGRSRGDGVADVIGEWMILPTPKMGDLSGLQDIVAPDQVWEQGQILLTEVSLSYSEDVICGRGSDGTPVSPSEVVYYEIRLVDIRGRVTQRRRFTLASPPYQDTARAEWRITLARAYGDRDRAGAPR